MKNKKWVALGFAVLIFLLGCKKDKTEVQEESGLTAEIIHYQSFESFKLSIGSNLANKSYYLHKAEAGNVAVNCDISLSDLETGGKEVLCWLEVEEQDLFFNGANLNLKVPYGSCDYVTYTPFKFYTYQPGTTNRTYRTIDTDGCVQCRYPDPMSGVCQNCDDLSSVITTGDICDGGDSKSGHTFYYDYSKNDGPNCDEGVSELNSLSFHDPTDAQTTSIAMCSNLARDDTSDIEGGGKFKNCLGGLGGDPKYIAPIYYDTMNGSELDFEIPSPMSKGYSTNRYIANYLSECATDSDSYNVEKVLAYTSLNLTKDRDEAHPGDVVGSRDPYKNGSPFYIWSCLDKAHEVKGRIYLQIRDWDKHFTMNDDLDKTAPEKMDYSEGSDEGTWASDAYNDRDDWDNHWAEEGDRCATDADEFSDLSFPGAAL